MNLNMNQNMNNSPPRPPLLLRQIGCQSMTDCTYDIEHLYKRMQNNLFLKNVSILYLKRAILSFLCSFGLLSQNFCFLANDYDLSKKNSKKIVLFINYFKCLYYL